MSIFLSILSGDEAAFNIPAFPSNPLWFPRPDGMFVGSFKMH
jgi:hypothetical protein